MPERKFSRADIIEAAFRVIRSQGWDKCSARAIARELGASTMPLYSGLKSMKTLEDEIAKKASDLLISYQMKPWSEFGFLDMGVGYVMFAQEEKHLFRMMYYREPGTPAERDMQRKYRTYVFDVLLEKLEHEEIMAGLSPPQRESVLYQMWVFSHGLAVLINNAVIDPMSKEEITRWLMDTGGLIITGERARSLHPDRLCKTRTSQVKARPKSGKNSRKKKTKKPA